MNNIKCHEVTSAARAMTVWLPMVEPWAAESVKRALVNVVEYRKSNKDSGSSDLAPLPPYAVKTVRAAIKHVNSIYNRMENQLERFPAPRGKFQ